MPCLDATAKESVATLHGICGCCLQVKARFKQYDMLKHYAIAARTANTFKEAQQNYLESVAEVKNLGDVIIRLLRDSKSDDPGEIGTQRH